MYYALWSLQRRFSLPRDRRRHDSQLDAALERFRRAAGERDALFGQVEELKAQLGALQVELGEAGVRLEDAALGVYAIKPQTLKGLTEKLDFMPTSRQSAACGVRQTASRINGHGNVWGCRAVPRRDGNRL